MNGQGLCWNPNAPSTLPTAGQTETSNTNYLRHYYNQFGWTQDLTYYHDGFDTHYNALQATLDKHFSQGLQFTARYSWQRAFNYANNDYAEIDRSVNYGRFDDLREQEFQLYGNYSLPFGRNKQFFSSAPKWVDYLVGGYNLSPSLNWSSGLPFSPSYGECGSDIPNGPCQPNKAIGTMPTNLTSFNTTSHSRTYFTPYPAFGPNGSTTGPFSRPNLDTFGDAQRNSYTGPSFFNTDLAASKNYSHPREHHSPVPFRCLQCLQSHQSGQSRKQLHRLQRRRAHHRDGNWSVAASTGVLCDIELLIRLRFAAMKSRD